YDNLIEHLTDTSGGGNCWTDSNCNFANGGGFCNLGTNSCACVNGYTGQFCQTAPASPGESSTGVSNVNNAILLVSLGAFLFIFLQKERNREDEDWIFYHTLYEEYLYQ
ncbi:transmembrane matrix receptor MUP-4-like, partial [Ostrea edulis]|uniref:transmembrane matrix receptor MUP-4-like n=1 Tax=Ostrea edulis TaxID=37623 RepID=UPI002094914E